MKLIFTPPVASPTAILNRLYLQNFLVDVTICMAYVDGIDNHCIDNHFAEAMEGLMTSEYKQTLQILLDTSSEETNKNHFIPILNTKASSAGLWTSMPSSGKSPEPGPCFPWDAVRVQTLGVL